MDKKGKGGKPAPAQGNVHPETQAPVRRGVADANSSKTLTGAQPDARSNHDKDGNGGNGRLAGSERGRR